MFSDNTYISSYVTNFDNEKDWKYIFTFSCTAPLEHLSARIRDTSKHHLRIRRHFERPFFTLQRRPVTSIARVRILTSKESVFGSMLVNDGTNSKQFACSFIHDTFKNLHARYSIALEFLILNNLGYNYIVTQVHRYYISHKVVIG